MPTPAELVLHHLCIKGLADPVALARCPGLPDPVAEAALAELGERELVTERTGRVAGFLPTPAGRAAHADALATDPLRARREELAPWYARFEEVNARLKALCTAWQVRDDGSPNDHADADHDAGVLAGLAELHVDAVDLLAEVGDDRLDRYGRRLDAAHAAVLDGDTRRFTAPLCESYHDVWMELHHDLLTSFGRSRTAADA